MGMATDLLTAALLLMACGTPVPETVVSEPTVIAFFGNPTAPSEGDSLDEFRAQAERSRPSLTRAGVGLVVLYPRREIRVRLGDEQQVLRPKMSVGYYFLAPGHPVQLQYGVLTDADLFAKVKQHLGVDVDAAKASSR
jgi:hypothetical protein